MEALASLMSSLKTADVETLDQEFGAVRSQTVESKRDLGLTSEAGALTENMKKNRYKDILPYDQSRVVLFLQTSDSDSDYINASFVKGATAGRCYIACQGPLSSTLTDFWRMIWQHNIKVIVMACREVEMGKRKCECYWPPAHQPVSFGPFTIHNQEEEHPSEDVVVRSLTVTFQQVSRSLIQYQFLSWPDHDVPYEATGVLDMLERVRTSQGTHTSPLLIHCSAGCGRTGVICALDYIHDLLVTKQIAADFSIMRIVLELRRQRPSAVQTKDQYRFIFTAAACMLERLLQPAARRLYSDPSETKSTGITATSCARSSLQFKMNDTYAVVNKPKNPQPPSINPAPSDVAPPQANRTLNTSHHYDNDAAGGPASPVYSIVRPRARPTGGPIYDKASPANHALKEGQLSPGGNTEYQLVASHRLSSTDDDYEDLSPSVCSRDGIGFNCRIQKPKGPRDPPAEWGQLER